jgi:hypothetical protein
MHYSNHCQVTERARTNALIMQRFILHIVYASQQHGRRQYHTPTMLLWSINNVEDEPLHVQRVGTRTLSDLQSDNARC